MAACFCGKTSHSWKWACSECIASCCLFRCARLCGTGILDYSIHLECGNALNCFRCAVWVSKLASFLSDFQQSGLPFFPLALFSLFFLLICVSFLTWGWVITLFLGLLASLAPKLYMILAIAWYWWARHVLVKKVKIRSSLDLWHYRILLMRILTTSSHSLPAHLVQFCSISF